MQRRMLMVGWVMLSITLNMVVASTECPILATSTSMRLKQKLLCNYDPELRPVKEHKDVTSVTYNLYLASVVFHEDLNTLEVRSWVNLKWRDEHLTWTKSDYQDLEKLPVRCNRIWIPDVALTSGPEIAQPDASASHCMVTNNGDVSAGLPVNHLAECVPDITRWPFDTHNCTMEIGSWAFFGNEVNLTFTGGWVSPNSKQDNRDWQQVGSSVGLRVEKFEAENQTWPSIVYSLVLQRHSGGAIATVFIPAIVLSTMTLATFWMEPGHPERLKLLHVNVVCHCMYMIYLGIKLPGNGDNTPLIITFFRDSFFLVGVSFLVSLCAGRMIIAARAPPSWITSITNGVLDTRPGQLLLFGETESKNAATAFDGEGKYEGLTMVEASAVKGWRLFAILLDRLCFFIFTISLFVLISGFIPKSL